MLPTLYMLNSGQIVQIGSMTGCNSNLNNHPTYTLIILLIVDKVSNFSVAQNTYLYTNGCMALLSNLLYLKPSHGPPSDHQMFLTVLRSNVMSYGDTAFYHAAPSLWNSLPTEQRICVKLAQFKFPLKTHLFLLTFPQD